MRLKPRIIDDVLARAIKTFVQAFCGILIPEIITILNNGLTPDQVSWAIIIPILSSSLAAGLSATWNLINNKLLEDEEKEGEDK